jgi:hypothetical protein
MLTVCATVDESEPVAIEQHAKQSRVEHTIRQTNTAENQRYCREQRLKLGEKIINRCFHHPNGISVQMREFAIDLLNQFISKRSIRVNNLKAAVCACIILLSQRLPDSQVYNSKWIAYIFPIDSNTRDMNKSIKRYMKEIKLITKLPEVSKTQEIEQHLQALCNKIQHPMICSQVSLLNNVVPVCPVLTMLTDYCLLVCLLA